VNSFGLPYHSGVIFFVLLLGDCWDGVVLHPKKPQAGAEYDNLGLTMVLIGYSSYYGCGNTGFGRSANGPELAQQCFPLISYLAREQYGANPLFYGQYYSAPQTDIVGGRMQYIMEDGRYVETTPRIQANTIPNFTGFFPGCGATSPSHIREYERWGMVEGRQVRVTVDGEPRMLYARPSLKI
jgi:hypothetical protein